MSDAHCQKISAWAEPAVERFFAALDEVRAPHPEVTIHEMIELIGEVVTRVLSVYGDPEYLRDEWGVTEEEIPSATARTEQVIDEIGQLPLW